jgi:hypothetical protein
VPIRLRIVLVLLGLVGGLLRASRCIPVAIGQRNGTADLAERTGMFINVVSRRVMFIVGVAMLAYAASLLFGQWS